MFPQTFSALWRWRTVAIIIQRCVGKHKMDRNIIQVDAHSVRKLNHFVQLWSYECAGSYFWLKTWWALALFLIAINTIFEFNHLNKCFNVFIHRSAYCIAMSSSDHFTYMLVHFNFRISWSFIHSTASRWESTVHVHIGASVHRTYISILCVRSISLLTLWISEGLIQT